MFNQHNQSKYLRSSVNGLIILIIILGTYFIAWAQKDPDIGSPPYKINGKEVKEYLIEKYQLRKDDVTSELKQTMNGPSGKLRFRGNITPKNIAMAEGIKDIKDRAKAIARAFLEEEASLFGITNMDEIREISTETDEGYGGDYTYIRYSRFINNLELDGVDIRITIGPDEMIRSVSTYIVPPPPQLYEAVKKKTLTEDEIRKIVEDDLKAAAVSPETEPMAKSRINRADLKRMEMRKLAIPSPPYVVWKTLKVWEYTINAFTGEILEKSPSWIELR